MTDIIDRIEAFVQIAIDMETRDCWNCEGAGHTMRPAYAVGPNGPERITHRNDCTECSGTGKLVPKRTDMCVVAPVFVSLAMQTYPMQQEGDLGTLEQVLLWAATYAREVQAAAIADLGPQAATVMSDALTKARGLREERREPLRGALTPEELSELLDTPVDDE